MRNRPELELMCRLLDQKDYGASVSMAVLACSKGAEVYSIMWKIGSARPDLKLTVYAVDISEEILEFAQRGIYSLDQPDMSAKPDAFETIQERDVSWNTGRDQNAWIFERMTKAEIDSMFEIDGEEARIKPCLKKGINWIRGDAGDEELVRALGPQDIVIANRFLCHMKPGDARRCIHNAARLVRPGGHLFVSGIDLDVRMRVARELGWQPIKDLMRDVHEGDPSLREGWPLKYWALEPFDSDRPDQEIRYASVFRLGGTHAPLASVSGAGIANSVAVPGLAVQRHSG
ncbi:MAG TPA: CheR family methyltransferase [Terriglobales bacterium]|nr:CheR family methyltransferase [Terriglobales bacterium]